ncbi:hypothetical protein M405DRAFT_810249 [Rhizopogon salebrosus TDB-379]|nr:hypothetical protein M405DRAFT_810249 [Rhizopogon salebrosus TDB-379]
MALSPNGKTIASGRIRGSMRLWEVETGNEGERGWVEERRDSEISKRLAHNVDSVFFD